MNCLTARRIILSKDTNAIDMDIGMAKQHIDSCHDCQQVMKQQEDFKRLLKTKLPDQPTPTTLRENILASIAAERLQKAPVRKRARFKRKSLLTAGAAAVFVVLMFFIYPGLFEREVEYANPVVRALAQDHLASKIRENPLDVQTADAAKLERWFALRVDFAVHIPTLNESTLLGGRLCVVNGERVAYLAFQKEMVPISMYIAERSAIDLAKMRIIASSGRKRILHGDAKGCNVIMWEERGLVFSVVSDMNEDELVELVAKS